MKTLRGSFSAVSTRIFELSTCKYLPRETRGIKNMCVETEHRICPSVRACVRAFVHLYPKGVTIFHRTSPASPQNQNRRKEICRNLLRNLPNWGQGGSENVIGVDVFRVWRYRVTLGHCTRHQGAEIKRAEGPRARRGRKELDPRCCNLGAHDF